MLACVVLSVSAVGLSFAVFFLFLMGPPSNLHDKIFPLSLAGMCAGAGPGSIYSEYHYDGTCPLHPSIWEATELQWAEYEAAGKPRLNCIDTPIRNPLCINPLGEILIVHRPCP